MNEIDQDAMEAALDAVMDVAPEPIVYRRMLHNGYDAETGTMAPMCEELDIYALKNGFGLQALGSSMGAGSVIEVGDINVTAPASQFSFEPSLGDQLIFDGKTWTIKGKRPQYGATEVVIWELQVRA
jgi:hypothetical protein